MRPGLGTAAALHVPCLGCMRLVIHLLPMVLMLRVFEPTSSRR